MSDGFGKLAGSMKKMEMIMIAMNLFVFMVVNVPRFGITDDDPIILATKWLIWHWITLKMYIAATYWQ